MSNVTFNKVILACQSSTTGSNPFVFVNMPCLCVTQCLNSTNSSHCPTKVNLTDWQTLSWPFTSTVGTRVVVRMWLISSSVFVEQQYSKWYLKPMIGIHGNFFKTHFSHLSWMCTRNKCHGEFTGLETCAIIGTSYWSESALWLLHDLLSMPLPLQRWNLVLDLSFKAISYVLRQLTLSTQCPFPTLAASAMVICPDC